MLNHVKNSVYVVVAACTNAACGLPAVPRGHCERESRDLKRCGWRRAFYGEKQCSKMEKQLSGSAKRKLKRKKELKLVDNLKHLPKIANYFTPNQCPLRKGDGNAEIPPSPVVAVETANVNVSASTSSQATTSVEASSETWDDSQLSQEQEDDEDEHSPHHHNEHDASPTERAETTGSSSPRSTFTLPSDPALWGPLTETLREEAIHRGPAAFHNRASRYPASVRESGLGCRTRSLTNDLFNCRLQNNEVVPREWLLYSPSTGSVYCYACKLLSPQTQQHAFISGFSDWKHSERIGDHEKSLEHRRNMLSLIQRSQVVCRVDAALVRQCEAEQRYWTEVLRRVVTVIKFLAARGLAFRGDNELLGSVHNGNYLGTLEVIAHFDPFLKEHLVKHGNKGKGKPSYISSTVCDEFIALMGDKTKQVIADEIKQAKYFSVIVDSTPDLSHVDQLTFVFRFVNASGKVVERFIGFEPIHSHTGLSLAESVISMVRNLGLDLANCRGQSYDNASNMSGKYNGLQAQLKKVNPLIHYTPCAAHSLNLVGVNTIEDCSADVISFFELLQSLYTFCSASTYRWNTVFKNSDFSISHTLKSLCGTRWSCRADSTKALCKNYSAIRDSLAKIASDSDEKERCKREASALVAKLDTLESVMMTMVWDRILGRFKATSDKIQTRDIDLATAVRLLQSLLSYVGKLRDQFAELEESARSVSATQDYQYDISRRRKRKRFSDESDNDEEVVFTNGSLKFKVETYYVIIDKLTSCLSKRIGAYTDVCELFGVLFDRDYDERDVRERAARLTSTYPTDLDASLADELMQFTHFVSSETSPVKMLQILETNGLKTTFPNIYVALKMFLTLPVSNCEGERSFSVLKRVKNALRTTMTQARLSALSLLSIENEVVEGMDFEDIVHEFAYLKSRRKATE